MPLYFVEPRDKTYFSPHLWLGKTTPSFPLLQIFVFNNECKGAPSRLFLIKNVRTLDQLKLKVADTLNIKPIRHLHRLDGVPVRALDEIPHMTELIATKHAGAPFDINDLPLHVKVGRQNDY